MEYARNVALDNHPHQLRQRSSRKKENNWLITLLLCWLLGVLGIHRFYTGHTTIGVIQLLTLGGCGIWTFTDFIILLIGNYTDANGNLNRTRFSGHGFKLV